MTPDATGGDHENCNCSCRFGARSCDEIDKQNALKKPYVFAARLHWTSILVLVVLAGLTGIVVPLVLMAGSTEPTRILAMIGLSATLLFICGSFIQFGRDVAAPSSIDFAQYLKGRWYAPFLKELDLIHAKMTNAGLLSRDVFLDASVSPDRKQFARSIDNALAQYLTSSDEYNSRAMALNQKVIGTVKSNSVLSPLIATYRGNKGGPILHPGEISDVDRLSNVVSSLKANPDVELSFEIDLPRGVSQVAAKFPTVSIASDLARLQSILSGLRTEVVNSDEYKQFTAAKENLEKAAAQLRSALNEVAGKG